MAAISITSKFLSLTAPRSDVRTTADRLGVADLG